MMTVKKAWTKRLDKERDNNLISYSKYGSEETISMNIEEFINKIKVEIKERWIWINT